MRMTVGELVDASGGRLLCGSPEAEISSVCTDSREVRPGALFVPIKGEKTDAHRYIEQTLAAGAAAVLTEEHDVSAGPGAWIRVEDTRAALQKIASAYRGRFTIPVVGITGSVGKTTTKEMVALALSAGLNVMKTEGNFNSQIGLPLTLFRLEPEHQAAVIEMGMSDFGEMARLSETARPTCAVMTNIGISHIEQLKTQENIRAEKLHIIDRFDPDSVLFLNGDDPLLADLKGKLPCRTVFYGTQPWCDYRAGDVSADAGGTRFTLLRGGDSLELFLPVPGMHNVLNALAAVAVADFLGVGKERASAALANYCPPAMRQQVLTVNGITMIDDSYNASPDSMRSSIDVLQSLKGSGKSVAVLADMLELGELSEQAHFDVGVYAAKAGVNEIVTIGKRAAKIAEGAVSAGLAAGCKSFLENGEAAAYLQSRLKAGDAVLVKGSRGMHTDEIVKALSE